MAAAVFEGVLTHYRFELPQNVRFLPEPDIVYRND
jgi:hypothetical protein